MRMLPAFTGAPGAMQQSVEARPIFPTFASLMIEAVYATRGSSRAVILAERVVVPVSGAQGDNRRRGDVRLGIDDVPLPMAVQAPLVARCWLAEMCRPVDAWEPLGAVPARLVRQIVVELRRVRDEREIAAKWAARK